MCTLSSALARSPVPSESGPKNTGAEQAVAWNTLSAAIAGPTAQSLKLESRMQFQPPSEDAPPGASQKTEGE